MNDYTVDIPHLGPGIRTGQLIRDTDGELALFKKVKLVNHLFEFKGWAVNRKNAYDASYDGAVRVILRDEHGTLYRCPMETVLHAPELPQLGGTKDRQLLIYDKHWDTPNKGAQQRFDDL